MVLKWIKSLEGLAQDSEHDSYLDSTQIGRQAMRRSSKKHNSGFVDSSLLSGPFGESELNAILQEVCDDVMPRKLTVPYKSPIKRSPKRHTIGKAADKTVDKNADKHDVPWGEILAKLGEEIAVTMVGAAAQLQEIALLHPQAAGALAAVTEQIEHGKRVAMIAQQVAHIRSTRVGSQPETLSLRDVIRQAIEQRTSWLKKRGVQARMGILDAQVHADAAALYTLVDELVNWAGGLAPEIGFAIDAVAPRKSARLQVIARIYTREIAPESWQNVGWFLWHQLANTLGAKADLEVNDHGLSVSVVFPPVPEPSETPPSTELELDHDIASIIAGCRVVLIAPEQGVRMAATQALSNLKLDVRNTWSVQAAREALGNAAPHAVVYDSALDPGEILQLRSDLAAIGKVAFVELSNHSGPDFHVSSLGTLSTAHVSVQAIAQSLAPALVFELCKVI
jgi:hypothetical protein